MNVNIERILLPTDFSENAREAFGYAEALSRRFEAELTLLHVMDRVSYDVYLHQGLGWTVPPVAPPNERSLTIPAEEWRRLVSAAENALENLAREAARPCRTLVRQGSAVEGILAEIDAWHPHLVVMGTHGWTGLRRLVLGSVTEKVVRLSAVPVLTVHPQDRAEAA